MAHPGKKLLFMGGEFGHFIEWKYDDQLDWFLLLYENHPQVQQCCKRLNEIYRTTPALYQIDDSWDGFQWIQANDSDNSIVAFLRTDKRGNSLLCVTNFTPVFHPQYRIGLPQMGTLTECFNTDRKEYGGSNQYNNWAIRTEEESSFRISNTAAISACRRSQRSTSPTSATRCRRRRRKRALSRKSRMCRQRKHPKRQRNRSPCRKSPPAKPIPFPSAESALAAIRGGAKALFHIHHRAT